MKVKLEDLIEFQANLQGAICNLNLFFDWIVQTDIFNF